MESNSNMNIIALGDLGRVGVDFAVLRVALNKVGWVVPPEDEMTMILPADAG